MAEEFYLDPDLYRQATRQLEEAGKKLEAAQKRLAGTLDQYEGCWGDDEIGKAFQKGYYDNAEKLVDGLGKAATGLVESASVARQNAEDFMKLDQDEAQRIDNAFDPQR